MAHAKIPGNEATTLLFRPCFANRWLRARANCLSTMEVREKVQAFIYWTGMMKDRECFYSSCLTFPVMETLQEIIMICPAMKVDISLCVNMHVQALCEPPKLIAITVIHAQNRKMKCDLAYQLHQSPALCTHTMAGWPS